MIRSAGWIFAVLGTAHTVLGLALTAVKRAPAWFGAELWRPEGGFLEMNPTMGAYWFTFASFGVPLLVLGLAILWIDRRGLVPPAFLGWILLAWALVNMVILLPSPWIAGVVGAVLYLAGVRRASRTAAEPAVAQAV
ncbi:DUF6463 family protein [Glycomyces algeriensis]|uniref:Uncharacterized protein n=1 Tax=Glycomyces algeriensis TaxID=256037 RepID=A0A9W6G4X2_9ACTN|nr:DUF6463 family protein [Glycomyces algeriensis]MDA1367193.1 DUF6463 family protein [Glycomyces algeriensis]MDR7353423.1 hypothetical protein [Glycomyces algeriensis]GLI41120.1 hypothetical protein GALLR39Z86_09700 [Glycomyces algeriensis]